MFPSALPASLWQFQLKIPPAVHLCVTFWWPAARRLCFAEREANLSLPLAGEATIFHASLCQTLSAARRGSVPQLHLQLRTSEAQILRTRPRS